MWHDVFPTVQVVKTNAQDMMIDLGTDKKRGKRFATLEFSSIGSGNAGKVRAENLLYCDDLVDGLESALSKERMDKLWNLYATDLRQRKIGDARELHIATRWSVHDVIGRLEQNLSLYRRWTKTMKAILTMETMPDLPQRFTMSNGMLWMMLLGERYS